MPVGGAATPKPESDRGARWVVVAMAGASFVSSLDLFVVNVAFDSIGAQMGEGHPGGPSPADLSWVLTAYAVAFAALLIPFGRLADRYGRKRLFLAGLGLFVLASAACAASGSVTELILFRALQAIGAAALTPTSLSILLGALPAPKRLAGVRFWAATGAVAAAVGPTVGGVLTQFSWRWVFLINLPIGLALLVIAARRVREERSDSSAPRPDLVGAVLLALAVALVALGLVKSADWGWVDPRTAAAFAGAVVAGAAFTAQSRRHPAPVVPAGLLQVRTFRFAVLAMFAFSIAFGSNLLLGILWLQQVWGWSPMTTGFAVALGPVMVPLTAALSGRLFAGVPPARLAVAGCLLLAVGVLVSSVIMRTTPSYWAGYAPGWLIGGVGVGLALPNLMGGATHDLPAHESGTGSGIVTMARQIGFVAGVSILFAIVGQRQGVTAEAAFRHTWWVMVGVLIVAALAAAGMRPARS